MLSPAEKIASSPWPTRKGWPQEWSLPSLSWRKLRTDITTFKFVNLLNPSRKVTRICSLISIFLCSDCQPEVLCLRHKKPSEQIGRFQKKHQQLLVFEVLVQCNCRCRNGYHTNSREEQRGREKWSASCVGTAVGFRVEVPEFRVRVCLHVKYLAPAHHLHPSSSILQNFVWSFTTGSVVHEEWQCDQKFEKFPEVQSTSRNPICRNVFLKREPRHYQVDFSLQITGWEFGGKQRHGCGRAKGCERMML